MEKSFRVGKVSNLMLDMLFRLFLLGFGIFVYKMKVLDYVIKFFLSIKYFVFLFVYMSGDMYIFLFNGNKDIFFKNFFCKYILVNIVVINLVYKIVFLMIF